MPKETTHYGWHYVEVTTAPPSEENPHGERYLLDRDKAFRQMEAGELDSAIVEHAYSPMLTVYWDRAALASTRFDEDPEGSVQIGLQVSELEMRQFVRMFEEAPQDDGNRNVLTRSMSREQVNKLIRTLKRARDAAYGRDE